MVDQILAFLRWQFSRFRWYDYGWMSGSLMLGLGYNHNETLFILGLLILFFTILGALISIQWNCWKRERKNLLDTIKSEK